VAGEELNKEFHFGCPTASAGAKLEGKSFTFFLVEDLPMKCEEFGADVVEFFTENLPVPVSYLYKNSIRF
jgi:hypothetical protein